jgi:hypothetical protein
MRKGLERRLVVDAAGGPRRAVDDGAADNAPLTPAPTCAERHGKHDDSGNDDEDDQHDMLQLISTVSDRYVPGP